MRRILGLISLFWVFMSLTMLAQVPTLKPAEIENPPLNITNRGISFYYTQHGSGTKINPGDYVFCTFSISYKDSLLHASRPAAIDNVVFIPAEYEKNPNAAIYEVFTFLHEGDKVYFDIPFKLLPWKDQVLKDTDSIRYVLAIDSIKNEAAYLVYYEQLLIEEEAKLDKNAEWFLTLKSNIKNQLNLYDQKDRSSGFSRHPSGYWYQMLRKGEGRPKSNGRIRYALYFKDGTHWNDLYFTPSIIELGSEGSDIHFFLKDIVENMQLGQRELVIVPAAMARDLGLHSNGVVGDLCFYLESLPKE